MPTAVVAGVILPRRARYVSHTSSSSLINLLPQCIRALKAQFKPVAGGKLSWSGNYGAYSGGCRCYAQCRTGPNYPTCIGTRSLLDMWCLYSQCSCTSRIYPLRRHFLRTAERVYLQRCTRSRYVQHLHVLCSARLKHFSFDTGYIYVSQIASDEADVLTIAPCRLITPNGNLLGILRPKGMGNERTCIFSSPYSLPSYGFSDFRFNDNVFTFRALSIWDQVRNTEAIRQRSSPNLTLERDRSTRSTNDSCANAVGGDEGVGVWGSRESANRCSVLGTTKVVTDGNSEAFVSGVQRLGSSLKQEDRH